MEQQLLVVVCASSNRLSISLQSLNHADIGFDTPSLYGVILLEQRRDDAEAERKNLSPLLVEQLYINTRIMIFTCLFFWSHQCMHVNREDLNVRLVYLWPQQDQGMMVKLKALALPLIVVAGYATRLAQGRSIRGLQAAAAAQDQLVPEDKAAVAGPWYEVDNVNVEGNQFAFHAKAGAPASLKSKEVRLHYQLPSFINLLGDREEPLSPALLQIGKYCLEMVAYFPCHCTWIMHGDGLWPTTHTAILRWPIRIQWETSVGDAGCHYLNWAEQ